MLLEIKKNKKLKNNYKKYSVLKCDQCGFIYEKPHQSYHDEPNKLNYCSKQCISNANKKGGVNEEKIKSSVKSRYGSEYYVNSEKSKIINKQKYGSEYYLNSPLYIKNNIDKYGVDFVTKTKEHKEKIKNSCFEKYGVTSVNKLNCIKEKIKQTNINKFGTEFAFQNEEIKVKIKNALNKKYGVSTPIHSKEIMQKIKDTNTKKYGTEYAFQSEIIKSKILQSNIEKYGVAYPMQNEEVLKKSHQTKKKTGAYKKHTSNVEDRLFEFLKTKYGKENVEQGKSLNKWIMDIYIKSLDLYINLDGEYWHGLDRPIEVIKASETKRDNLIYKVYLRGINLRQFFKENNMKLVIITDKEYIYAEKQCQIDELIIKKIMSLDI